MRIVYCICDTDTVHMYSQMADSTLKAGNVPHRVLHSREGFLPDYINRLESLRGHEQKDTTRTQNTECLNRKCHHKQKHNQL